MLRRRMLHAGIAIAMVAASIVGLASPANASPTSFVAKAVHANGAGALAVEATGGFIWWNRSVSLTSVKFYANAGECGYLLAIGYHIAPSEVDRAYYPSSSTNYCTGATGQWFPIGDFTLDGSDVYGGITEVEIIVFDVYHNIAGYAYCYRDKSSCYTYQG